MLNPLNYKPWLNYGQVFPIKFANAHAIREAGRLIYNADHRVKTDMRISMQERTHAYRHHLHHYLREAGEQTEENQQEITQVRILEDYAAMVEGALTIDGIKPFGYAGLEMQEALTSIQTSLKKLEKRGAHRTKHASLHLSRLKTIVSRHEEKKEALASIKSMRAWVVEAEHIFDGSWAKQPEEITNAEVGRRFDAYLARLSCFLAAKARTEDEKLRLAHLLKVLTHVRPGLIHCYDLVAFPRTNNDMERTIRAIKMHYRRISGRKNWNKYLLRYGRCVAYQEWWMHQPDGEVQLHARLQHVASSSWRQVRQETRDAHQEQLNRYRFRHRPLDYLASLELRWEQTSGT